MFCASRFPIYAGPGAKSLVGLEFVSAAPNVADPKLGVDPTDDETAPLGSDRAGIE